MGIFDWLFNFAKAQSEPVVPQQPKPEPKFVASKVRVRGVDLSHHNSPPDFKAMKAGGYEFVFLKATESTGYVDPTFHHRWAQAKDAGILRGAYHFFRPQHDAKAQAEHFLSVIGKLEANDLPCVFDWEVVDGVGRDKQIPAANVWLDIVHKATGKRPIIYGGPSFLADSMKPPVDFAAYKLWIANYGVKVPKVPAPWGHWTFWQDSEAGVAPGVAGHCDIDYFNGSIDELSAFAKS
jgi:lysozyme